ncbi:MULTISPECIES: phosphomannomutase [unclassified Massilia]|uniref:phosphomannomutase n=1 Tax=unclassified Massilia TaxID=2609279 RepID=UPI00177DA78C|nr:MULTISPECIES: phosphomannomutase [unclassified Massilia]MBD8528784.1 phosphomannomutase [Massilia sp. CFBP 13647]MBD8673425.1 phosphomannomutase [Massilia sp. CFBP 13721]
MAEISMRQLVVQSGVQFGTSGARGLVAQMSDAICYAYAQAFLKAVADGPGPVIIGHDLRPSSPAIAGACAQAVRDAGREVVFVGPMPTPAVAYYAATRNASSLVITGSHIPFDRNGIKFYKSSGEISKDDEQAMLAADVDVPDNLVPQVLAPAEAGAMASYVRRYTQFFKAGSLAGMRVALYEHSSVGRDVLRVILEALGAEVLSLGRTDTFVPIDTEAVRPEDVARAREWAAQYDFDVLVSTDGDADRPLIGDEQGSWLRGDVVGVLCSEFLGASVVATPVSSNTAVEACGAFTQVVRTRIGSPYVIAAMEAAHSSVRLQDAVIVGYEANGGFLLGSAVVADGVRLDPLPTRDAVLPILTILTLARNTGRKVSELAAHLPKRFTASDRLQNFASEDSHALLASLAADLDYAARLLAPASGAVVETSTIDGLRLTFAGGDIVHLRASGNAPELRCYAEAGSEAHARALCLGCLQRISA